MSHLDGNVDANDELSNFLRRGLRADPLTPEALERIRSATRAEWSASIETTHGTRRWMRHASAAAAAGLLLAGAWFAVTQFATDPPGAVLGQLVRADYPGAVERHRWSGSEAIAIGHALRERQDISVRGGAIIAMVSGGTLRLAAGTGISILSDHVVRLNDGDIYIDIPPLPKRQVPFIVQTPVGTFTHLGTQFHVAVHGDQTLIRVREGQVRWQSAEGDIISDAGTQLRIDAQGRAKRTEIATSGPEWTWAEALGPSFDIENRTLADFLRFIARETGRKLAFASPAVEQRASTLRLHGSIDKLAPADALAAVMATTSLRYAVNSTSIRIDFAGDTTKAIHN